jgi:hypothetical protein
MVTDSNTTISYGCWVSGGHDSLDYLSMWPPKRLLLPNDHDVMLSYAMRHYLTTDLL